jgi:hypothetical protein
VSKINVIDDSYLPSIISTKDQEKTVTTLKHEDLAINLVLISSKNYVELVSKDFAKNYQNVVQVYQNEMGYLDKFQKLLNAKPEQRVFIQYNDIVSSNEDKSKVTLKNVIQPLPVPFRPNSNHSRLLQRVFNVVRYLALQRIYKNNYSKHCINKIIAQNPQNTENETTHINMCVIMLEHSNDLNNNSMNLIFLQTLLNNFKTNLNYLENLKTSKEEYAINVNYGITSLEKNKVLHKLYKDYIEAKNITPPKENSKLFLIINDTQEKFVFKWFKDEEILKEYLVDLDKSDYFEDGQFGVKK